MKYTLFALVLLSLTGCNKLYPFLFNGGTPEHLTVLLIGQSNMERFYGAGEQAFRQNIGIANVTFIRCAVGGTTINQWQADGSLMQQCNTAGQHIDLILFYQGESDAVIGTQTWAYQFSTAVAGWRKLYGNVPVVFAQIATCDPIFTSSANWASIQQQQASVYLSNVRMITTGDLTDRVDEVHLTPASERIVGTRFALEVKG